MSFSIRLVESDMAGDRWRWFVHDGKGEHFIRDGQITGDQDEAERAARTAFAIMGDVVREEDE